VEDLHSRAQLALRDVETVYEGLFLRSVTGFEDLLECVFFRVLNGDVGGSRLGGKISAQSRAVMRDVLLDGDDYLDWLPYKKTLDRARRYLRGGRPFNAIEGDDLNKLSQLVRIRNAVAHSSKHATRVFQQKVIANIPLLPRDRKPASFLRTIFRTAPAMTRFEMYVAELGQMAAKLDA
jgi:hypothetical protein